jgi:hypothetical protein
MAANQPVKMLTGTRVKIAANVRDRIEPGSARDALRLVFLPQDRAPILLRCVAGRSRLSAGLRRQVANTCRAPLRREAGFPTLGRLMAK